MTDPRIAASVVVGGPPEWEGKTLVAIDRVTLGGKLVDLPRVHPGIPELVAVGRAERAAEEMRARLLATLVTQPVGPPLWQPDGTLVVDMRSAAESVVTTAVVGLESFASEHINRAVDPATGTLVVEGVEKTVKQARELSLHERYKVVLPGLYGRPRPGSEPWYQVLRRIQGLAALTRHAIYEPIKRPGLTGEKQLVERLYEGEYVGATAMLISAFEYFEPTWIPAAARELLP